MTSKLIKFEIKSSIRLLGVLWAALITASLFLGIEGRVASGNIEEPVVVGILDTVLPIIYAITFLVMIVAVVLVVIVRFYKGLLGEEGYLMHTLPVKTWQLVTSKGVCAFLIVISSAVVMGISILLSNGIAGLDIKGMFESISDDIHSDINVLYFGIEAVILGCVFLIVQIYKIYVSMAIGQLSSKHRVLASIGSYVGIGIVENIIRIAVISSIDVDKYISIESATGGHLTMWLIILAFAAEAVLYHIVTVKILSNRLNLQ